MLTIRIYLGLLLFSSMSLVAETSAEKFAEIESNLKSLMKSITEQNFSSNQLIELGKHVMGLEEALETCFLEVSSNDAEISYKNPINIPPHVLPKVKHTNGARQFHSPTKRKAPELPKQTAAKKSKTSHQVNEQESSGIYTHSMFHMDYEENNIIPFNAQRAKDEIEKNFPGIHKKTKRKRLMLEVEKHFRTQMKQNADLIKVVKYVGLCEDDSDRVKGHARDLCNEKKCLSSNKSIYESMVLGSRINLRMNMAIKNLKTNDLGVFEALMARIFPVQAFGASAKIADGKAFDELSEYLGWKERIKELKRLELDNVVEEQIEGYFIRGLPSSWKFQQKLFFEN